MDSLYMRNFPRRGQASRELSSSSSEQDDGSEGLGGAVGPSLKGFREAEEAAWKQRLEHLWDDFRTADYRDIGEWMEVDRAGCVKRLALILELPVWHEQRLEALLDEIRRSRPGTGGLRAWTRGRTPVAAPPRPVEVHWRQQLRAVVPSPMTQEVWVDVSHL